MEARDMVEWDLGHRRIWILLDPKIAFRYHRDCTFWKNMRDHIEDMAEQRSYISNDEANGFILVY